VRTDNPRERNLSMQTVGIIATFVVAGTVLAAAATFLVSLPDIARYRRLRRM
jgi:hypothetical protein